MLHLETDATRFLEDVGLCHLMVSQSGEVSGTARAIDPVGAPIDRAPEHECNRSARGAPILTTA